MERKQFTAEQIIQILKEGRERITFGRSAANIRGCLERGNLSVQWMTQGTDPTDLSDAEWGVRAPLIPPAKPGGRPRTTDMREVLNVIFYLLRGGGAWRLLPRLPRELPAWQPGKVRRTLSPRHSWGHYFVAAFLSCRQILGALLFAASSERPRYLLVTTRLRDLYRYYCPRSQQPEARNISRGRCTV